MNRKVVPSLAAVCTLAVLACGHSSGSGQDQVILADGVSVFSSQDAADVTVLPDRLIFPAADHGDVLSKPAGAVLVGDRAPGASQNNPRGFLRKVASVSQQGATIVVMTNPATLLDVVKQGSFEQTLQVPALGATGPVAQSGPASLHPLGNGSPISLVDLSGKTLLHSSGSVPVGNDSVGYDALLQLKTATLDFTPKIDVGAKISLNLNDPLSSLQEFHLKATGTLDADLEVEAKLALTGNPTNADVAQLIAKEIFQSSSTTLVDYPVNLGSISMGPLNMPASAEFKVTVACDQVKWGGATDVVFGGKANASVTAGFQYDPNSGVSPVWSHSESLNVVGPNWTLDDEVSAHCWIQPELDLSLFDVASGQVWADAWGAMSADATCDANQKATGQLQGTAFAGVSATAHAKVDVLGLIKWEKQCTLFAIETPHENVQATFSLPAGSSATCTTPAPDPMPVHVDSPPPSCFGSGQGSGGDDGGGVGPVGDDAATGDDATGDDATAGDAAGGDAGSSDAADASDGAWSTACDHDVCTEGDALSPTCTMDGQNGACIASICQNDPYCCQFAWTGSCVAHVTNGDFACTARTCVDQ